MNEILTTILLTLAPFFELRAGIPYGILKTDLSVASVVIIAIIVNSLLAPLLYVFVNFVIKLFLHIKFIDKIWQKIIVRAQKKIHPYVEKYGIVGLALFIGVPLPGSGVYTGALGAYALGFTFKEYVIAAIIGVLIAATAVTLITLFGEGIFLHFIKV